LAGFSIRLIHNSTVKYFLGHPVYIRNCSALFGFMDT